MLFVLKTFVFCLYVTLGLCQQYNTPCSHSANSRCFDSTCALPLLNELAGTPCLCVDDDIGSMFGDCNTNSNTRDLIYFWKPPATCLNGTLPPPVQGVPCGLRCGDGTYLNVSNMACNDCQKGYYSNGGGVNWDDWHYMPSQFSTHCAIGNSAQTCSSWRLNGETIDSGDNYNYHYLESVLQLRVHLVENGSVSFEYKVSAEAIWDGLWFLVDDLGIFFESNTNWKVATRNLTAGYHTLTWQYYKDRSITGGEDKATLKWIRVTGITYAKTECDECPLGHYSNQTRASSCTPCEPGTYNPDTIAATSCKPCPSGMYSFVGATQCFPRRACNTSAAMVDIDYTYYYSPCINTNRIKHYMWFNPPGCDITNRTLPRDETLSCAPTTCKPGQFLNSPSNVCTYCPDGTASSSSASSCQTCQPGQAASDRIIYFDDWNLTSSKWPQSGGVFTTGCNGEACFTNGWRRGNFLDSGVGHGQNAQSWLQYVVDVKDSAEISFDYSAQCQGDNDFTFTVDDIMVLSASCTGCQTTPTQFKYTIHFGNETIKHKQVTLTWTYSKRDQLNTQCDRAIIYDMSIKGVWGKVGGSASCTTCPAGSFTNTPQMSQCQLCPPGSTSNVGATGCSPCGDLTFADTYGSPKCLTCGAGTVSNSDHSRCVFNCSNISFAVNNTLGGGNETVYDLSKLSEFNVTYMEMQNNTIFTVNFQGNVCGWPSACGDINNTKHGYICIDYPIGFEEDDTKLPLGMGKAVEISEVSPRNGVQLQYKYGSYLNGKQCSATLSIMCDPVSIIGADKGPSINGAFTLNSFDSNCQVNLMWKSKYGCPICQEADYAYYDGECKGGKAERVCYRWNTYCFGGAEQPANSLVPCVSHVTVARGTIAALIAVGVIAGVAAVGVIIFLWRRNRALYADYNKLMSRDIPLDDDQTFRLDEEPDEQ